MRALYYEQFKGPVTIRQVPDPEPAADDVVIRVEASGLCPQCATGNQQICDAQFQPGFTHWGSFAEYVAISYADLNLVAIPDAIDFATAASLGCRFATSFRAVVDQGRVAPGQS